MLFTNVYKNRPHRKSNFPKFNCFETFNKHTLEVAPVFIGFKEANLVQTLIFIVKQQT